MLFLKVDILCYGQGAKEQEKLGLDAPPDRWLPGVIDLHDVAGVTTYDVSGYEGVSVQMKSGTIYTLRMSLEHMLVALNAASRSIILDAYS